MDVSLVHNAAQDGAISAEGVRLEPGIHVRQACLWRLTAPVFRATGVAMLPL
jgi:hypothetical protein